MKRFLILVLVLLGNFLSFGQGLVKSNMSDFSSNYLKQDKRLAKVTDLPPVVDFRPLMPPVLSQGGQNSCLSFAMTYALGYMKNKEEGYSLSHQYSQSFIYNTTNIQGDGGERAFNILTELGFVKASVFPYYDTSYSLWPNKTIIQQALPERIKQWSWFYIGDTLPRPSPGSNPIAIPGYLGVNTARSLLAAGKIVTFAFGITNAYSPYYLQPENWVYSYEKFNQFPCVGGHALCIAGYNDTMRTRDGRGAFLIINSFGSNMFDYGYTWITYKEMAARQYEGRFYTLEFREEEYKPQTLVELELENFGCLYNLFDAGFKVGENSNKQQIWKYRWYNPEQKFFDTAILDMTDISGIIDTTNSQTQKFFIKGSFQVSKFGPNKPKIKSVHIVDTGRKIDTYITANLTITDSIFYAEWPFQVTTGVDDEAGVPNQFMLAQNYPNPFNPATTISFSLGKPGLVSLKVYDLLGREVANLINGYLPAGQHKSDFKAQDLSSGIYIYKLQTADFTCSKKMTLLK